MPILIQLLTAISKTIYGKEASPRRFSNVPTTNDDMVPVIKCLVQRYVHHTRVGI